MNTLFNALVSGIVEIAAVVLSGLAGWVAALLARRLKLSTEEALRRPLIELVDTMAQAVRVRFGGVSMTPELVERVVPDLAAHVERSYPERIRALGVERPSLENMIRVRLGVGPTVRP